MISYGENLFCNDYFDDVYISNDLYVSSTPHTIENNQDPSTQDIETFSPLPI